VEFHWVDKHQPLLTEKATCTTCHRVHQARPEQPLVEEPLFAALGLEPGTPWPLTDGRILGSPQDPPVRDPARAQPTNGACFRCHQPAFDVLPGTVHEKLGRLTTPLDQGCGSCHAGSENHAMGAGRADLVESMHGTSAALQMATCGKCHGDEEALRHINVGAHNRSEVSCLSCHSPAAPKGRVLQDAESKCQTCHQNVAAQFRQPNRHPVPEGNMWCSDCHEPHGARRKFRDLELRQRKCVTCHREYRGPYVFAHQASRVDGCVICHSPHGSSNNRMLMQATSQQNCLQCHGDFPAFHDQTLGAVFTNCLNCHTEIHGSNHNRFLIR
jgi:DmsE family decaheme c-type cytochrome